MKVCKECGLNPVRGPRSYDCASCHIALRKANQNLAAYRHRARLKDGKARRNRTYRGGPTANAIREAIKILAASGYLNMPVIDDEPSLSNA